MNEIEWKTGGFSGEIKIFDAALTFFMLFSGVLAWSQSDDW